MRQALLLLAALAVSGAPALAQSTQAGEDARLQGRFVRAMTALTLEDDSSAIRALDVVLQEAPDDPTVLSLRAEASLLADDPADAIFYARRATDAAPDRADLWRQLAAAHRAAGQDPEAAGALAEARQLAPDDLDVLLALLDLAASQGDEEAERDLLLAVVRQGDTVAARLRLSVLAERAGDAEDARTQARAAARLAPSEPAVVRRLADLSRAAPAAGDGASLFADGRYAEAADALLAEIDADPRQVESWALALQALARLSDPRARATADDALILFGSVPAILTAAAEAYASTGETVAARDAARRGLEALALLGDALPDAEALRSRLDSLLARL